MGPLVRSRAVMTVWRLRSKQANAVGGQAMSNAPVILSAADEEALVREFAQQILEAAAPEELAVFDETADEYFADPGRAIRPSGTEEPVGFGIEFALLTPYILAVVTPVIQMLASMVSEAVKAEGQSAVSRFVRRLMGRSPREAPTGSSVNRGEQPPMLTSEQILLVRDVAFARGRTVGLPDDRAALLADAIAGGVTTGSVD